MKKNKLTTTLLGIILIFVMVVSPVFDGAYSVRAEEPGVNGVDGVDDSQEAKEDEEPEEEKDEEEENDSLNQNNFGGDENQNQSEESQGNTENEDANGWTKAIVDSATAKSTAAADASFEDTKLNRDMWVEVTAHLDGTIKDDKSIYLVAVNQETNAIEYVLQEKNAQEINEKTAAGSGFTYTLSLVNDFSGMYHQYPATLVENGEVTRENVFVRPYLQKLGLAMVNSDGKFELISENSLYVTNSEALAYTTDYSTGNTIKGIQGSEYIFDFTDLSAPNPIDVDHVYLNLYLSDVFAEANEPGAGWYAYNGTAYYVNDLGAYLTTIQAANLNGISVTLQVMLDWDTCYTVPFDYPTGIRDGAGLVEVSPINSKAKESRHQLYSWEHKEKVGREAMEAAFVYIADKFCEFNAKPSVISANEGADTFTKASNNQVFVSNWILGNEVNSHREYQYKGSMTDEEFFDSYAEAYAAYYRAIKSMNAGAHVYMCLDHCWNSPDHGYSSKQTLDEVAARLASYDASIKWDVAFHPYANPLDATAFWTNSGISQDVNSTSYINMSNLNVLTDYLKSSYPSYGGEDGSKRQVILSEQGYTSASGETLQAAALV